MSNELIPIRAWIEKHSFDQGDTFSFLVGKTIDDVIVKSVNTKVSEVVLDSYINDVRSIQKRKPESIVLKIEKFADKLQDTFLKTKNTVLKKQIAAKRATIDSECKFGSTIDYAPKQIENDLPSQSTTMKPTFTADTSKVVDPAVLARIQKSKQEKAAMRIQRNTNGSSKNWDGQQQHRNKQTSATSYSGNLRSQPRQIENKVQAGTQISHPDFGTTHQNVLSASTPIQSIKHCVKCKEKLEIDAQFCSECGIEQKTYFSEQKSSKKITEYVLKDDVRVGNNAEIEIKIQENESPKEIQETTELKKLRPNNNSLKDNFIEAARQSKICSDGYILMNEFALILKKLGVKWEGPFKNFLENHKDIIEFKAGAPHYAPAIKIISQIPMILEKIEFLEQKLRDADKIYIDTCSLMETPIEKFFEKANPILKEYNKKIIVVLAVELELKD